MSPRAEAGEEEADAVEEGLSKVAAQPVLLSGAQKLGYGRATLCSAQGDHGKVLAVQPRVLLLGDSICTSPGYSFGSGGYAPLVAARLRDRGIAVDYYRASGWSTRHFLALLTAGELPSEVDLIHFNVGLHDIARQDDASGCAVPLEEYARNLRAIVELLRAGRAAELVWAATTPIHDGRHRREKRFIRRDADVRDYNRAAATVMRELHVAAHDLYQALTQAGGQEGLGPDGVHPTEAGRELLAAAVSDLLREQLGLGNRGAAAAR